MLSGVGPGPHLNECGIDVLVDTPGVGANLQDHPIAGVLVSSRQTVTLANVESPGNLLKYLVGRVGPLTSNVAEAGGFVHTRSGLAAPNIQFHFAPNYFRNHGSGGGHGFSLGATLIAPKSVGHVRLRSRNAHHPPLIDPAYLTDPDGEDLAAMLAGVRLAREILAAPPLAPFYGAEFLPGIDVQDDDGLCEHIRATSETLYHPVGTCKMGPDDDPNAVVDRSLRLRGVDGVRVVDASVMPTVPRGNTNAPTMMIAEKIADEILAEC